VSEAPVSPPADSAARALLAAPVTWEGTDISTVGELIAGFTVEAWKSEPRFASFKSAVYLAAVDAGLVPGEATGQMIRQVDVAAAEALTEAAIRAMGQPSPVVAALRAMISAKQPATADAGISRGLSPGWHQAAFSAAEIEAAIAIAAGQGPGPGSPVKPEHVLSGGEKVERLVHKLYGLPEGF
jgi:hypothetical protein